MSEFHETYSFAADFSILKLYANFYFNPFLITNLLPTWILDDSQNDPWLPPMALNGNCAVFGRYVVAYAVPREERIASEANLPTWTR